jgi:hypothetical protein
MVASNPPADPPTPTIGQAKSFDFERAVRRADFTPLLFAFAFARDAFFCAVRFAAMAAFLRLIPRADHTSMNGAALTSTELFQVDRDRS